MGTSSIMLFASSTFKILHLKEERNMAELWWWKLRSWVTGKGTNKIKMKKRRKIFDNFVLPKSPSPSPSHLLPFWRSRIRPYDFRFCCWDSVISRQDADDVSESMFKHLEGQDSRRIILLPEVKKVKIDKFNFLPSLQFHRYYVNGVLFIAMLSALVCWLLILLFTR